MGGENPVWSVYDALRTASLNVKYYSRRLARLESWNLRLELILAASAPSSAIAGLWFWQNLYGAIAWRGFGVVAAVAALLKPALSLPRRIKDHEGVVAGYRALEYDLKRLRLLIEQRKKYPADLQAELAKALEREAALAVKIMEAREEKKLKAECALEVKREFPVESFYEPPED
jgi:hypothetical protein